MPFPGLHVETGSFIGSWPILPLSVGGVSVTLPRTIQSKATILGSLREPSAGFDVDGRTFILTLDGGTPVPVGFTYGTRLPLSVVISQINTAMGATVALNDNGFLKLQSPTEGTGSLRVDTDPSSSPTDCLLNLGLFPGIEAYAGALTQTQSPDPDRQVATPGQMTVAEGECFEARVFNRAIAQLSINNDRNEGQLSKKRLAAQGVYSPGSPYTKPGTVDGLQVADGSLVYVGKETAPSIEHLRKLFTVLDSEGRELIKETFAPVCVGEVYDFSLTTDGTGRQKVASDAFLIGGWEKGSYYLVVTGLTGGASVLNGVPLKIIEEATSGPDVGSAIVENIDPATGTRVTVTQSGVSGTVVSRGLFPVVVDGVYESITQAEAGTPRLENVRVSKRTGVAPTRIELGNRIVCVGEDFLAAPYPQVGDIVTWTGATVNSPFNNNGDYRIDKILDKETLQVVAPDWGAAILNPSSVGGSVGTISITTDGAFVKNPFLRFSADTSAYGVPIPTTDTIQAACLKASTFRDATDANPAFLQDELQHTLDTDSIEQAVIQMWGPSVSTVDQVLYQDYRINLESINSRLNWEHYNYDDTEKTGGSAVDTRSWGRHKDIRPDTIDMWYWTPSVTTPRVTLRGTATRGHGADSNESGDHLLQAVRASGTSALNIYGDGRMTNHATAGSDTVRVWQDFDFPERTDERGLGGTAITGERIIWRGKHSWTGSSASPSSVQLCGQHLWTELDLTTSTAARFGSITGQRITIDGATTNTHWANALRFVHLDGSLNKSVTDYGDNRDAVSSLYGIHVDYTLSSNFKILGDHYGLKIEDITRAGGTNYSIYTGAGFVQFGDKTRIVNPYTGSSNYGLYVDVVRAAASNEAHGVRVAFPTSAYTGSSLYGFRVDAGTNATDAAMYGLAVGSITAVGHAYGVWLSGVSSSGDDYNVRGFGVDTVTAGNAIAEAFFCNNVTCNASGSGYSARGFVIGGTIRHTSLADGEAVGFAVGGPIEASGIAKGLHIEGVGPLALTTSCEVTGAYIGLGVSGTAANRYGIRVNAISGTSTTNYGIKLGAVSGATSNYAIYTDIGPSRFGDSVDVAPPVGAAYGVQIGAVAAATPADAYGLTIVSVDASAHPTFGATAWGMAAGNVTGKYAYGISLGDISALLTASGIVVGTIHSGGDTAVGIQCGNVSTPTTDANAYGLLLGTVTGKAAYGISLGNVTSASLAASGVVVGAVYSTGNVAIGVQCGNVQTTAASSTAYGLLLGTVTESNAAGNAYGMYLGNVSAKTVATGLRIGEVGGFTGGVGTAKGIDVGGLYDSSNNSYGVWIQSVRLAATKNYGVYVNDLASSGSGVCGGFYAPTPAGIGATYYGLHVGGTLVAQGNNHYGVYIGSMGGGDTVAAGVYVHALGLSTAGTLYGFYAGPMSGSPSYSYGFYVGDITSTSTGNMGLRVGSVTGAASNYGAYIAARVSTTGDNWGLFVGAMTGSAGYCYGIEVGAISATTTNSNFGFRIGAVTGAPNNYGGRIEAISSTSTGNYGLSIGSVTGATANYAIVTGLGVVSLGDRLVQTTTSSGAGVTYAATFANLGNSVDYRGVRIECGGTSGELDDYVWVALDTYSGTSVSEIRYSGTSPFATFAAPSDERLKKNIQPTALRGLDILSAIELKSFDFIDGKLPHQEIGYIAQQVQSVYPPMVSRNSKGMLYVGDSCLIPLLVKAVQELKSRIELLEGWRAGV
jgi:hypothetical protein